MPNNIPLAVPGAVQRSTINTIITTLNETPTAEDVTNEITTTVVPMVEDAIANDETVQTAITTAINDEDIPGQVETAVDDKVAGLDIIEAQDLLPEVNEEIVFAIAGEDNSRTWLEIGADGAPTQNSLDLFDTKTPLPKPLDAGVTGVAYAVAGEDDSRTWLEVAPDGGPTEHALSLLTGAITGGTTLASWVITSGDSMTGGAGGTPYPQLLNELEPDWNVINMGAGGETSTTIFGRMGGRPMLATVTGSQIPTSGGVVVTLTSDDGEHTPTPLLQQTAGVNPVFIAGVEGTLSVASGVYTFTRTTAGSAVPAVGLLPVSTRSARDYRTGIHVMWPGTNDGTSSATAVIRRIRAQIEFLTDPVPRYLVIAPTASAMRVNASTFLQEFGRRFIDALAFLQSDAAFTIAGVTKTGTDTTDIGNNNVPTSFRSDATHLNTIGNGLVALLVRDRIKEMGWL